MAINAASAPGLYIVELPSNAHTIQAAPKSIAVFVGYTHPFKTRHFNVAVEVDSFTEYERQFGGLYASGVVDAHVAYSINEFFLSGGVQAYVVGLEPSYWDQNGNNLGKVAQSAATTTVGGITFTARELTDLIPLRVTIDNINAGKADITIAYGPSIETYRGINLTPGDPNYIEARIGVPTKEVSALVTVSPAGAYAFQKTSNQALISTAPAGVATTFSEADFSSVFDADSSLDKLDIFNLLLIPGVTDNNICSAALAFAERKHAFVVLDPPAQAAADDSAGLTPMQTLIELVPKSPNGSIYFPYLRTIDPLTAMPVELPPSGFVAGKIAEMDQIGPWMAAAGLGTVIATTTGVVGRGRMTEARLGKLNQLGVNCLRTLPGIGTVIWGARTLVANNPSFQQWPYSSVRRTALFIEQSLLMSLTWAVFQPNDDPLYLALRTSVTGFMLSLFNAGAFEGATPSQAFRVLCDRTTTTDDDRANGICNIVVAFRPLKPAEFVVIKIAQLAGQAA